MGFFKFQIDKFDGKGDFNMWTKKMRVVLVQQKCAKALEGTDALGNDISNDQKQDIIKLTYSLIILADNVLHPIDEENTATKVWLK